MRSDFVEARLLPDSPRQKTGVRHGDWDDSRRHEWQTAGQDGLRHEKDGDTHGWLKLDSQFTNLLNAGNKSNEDENMVFEVVCKFPVHLGQCEGGLQGVQEPHLHSSRALTWRSRVHW
jgi:hypothetical protein